MPIRRYAGRRGAGQQVIQEKMLLNLYIVVLQGCRDSGERFKGTAGRRISDIDKHLLQSKAMGMVIRQPNAEKILSQARVECGSFLGTVHCSGSRSRTMVARQRFSAERLRIPAAITKDSIRKNGQRICPVDRIDNLFRNSCLYNGRQYGGGGGRSWNRAEHGRHLSAPAAEDVPGL